MCKCRVQSLFDSLGDEVKGSTIGLGGDGRYFNKEAVQTILKLAAGAGVKKVCAIHILLSSNLLLPHGQAQAEALPLTWAAYHTECW